MQDDEATTGAEMDAAQSTFPSSSSSSSSKTLSQAAAELQAKQHQSSSLLAGAGGSSCLVDNGATSSSSSSAPSGQNHAAVDVRTGEEDESNVMQITCKLYLYNPSSTADSSSASTTWVERGRGFLRLNDIPQPDMGGFKSRLVMRAQVNFQIFN